MENQLRDINQELGMFVNDEKTLRMKIGEDQESRLQVESQLKSKEAELQENQVKMKEILSFVERHKNSQEIETLRTELGKNQKEID